MSSSQDTPSRGDYSHIPIPTYEEAISSRPGSSHHSFLGPSEISHDAERQTLLSSTGGGGGGGPSSSRSASRYRNYRTPTVESARTSLDSLDNLSSSSRSDGGSARASMEELRREMSEMEFEDPNDSRRRNKWSARGFASAFNNLGNIRGMLPRSMRDALPSWEAVRSVLPRPPSREALREFRSRLDLSVVVRVLALAFIVGMAYLVFFSEVFRVRRAQHADPMRVRKFVRDSINEGMIRQYAMQVTSEDHIAGTVGSYVLGQWIEKEWTKMELKDVEMERFEVYLNYPIEDGRKVAIIEPENLRYTAELKEAKIYPDTDIRQAAVFHGHSANGNATGPLIYANYGSRDDFAKLKDLGIEVKGAIVLMRYGGTEPDRALKVKAAQLEGAAGALIYSDPADQDKDFPPFNGPWRADDSVQRGTVSDMAMVMGDVLSPGFASTPEEKNRLAIDSAKDRGYIPSIPSIPLSEVDAQRFLDKLKGFGKPLKEDAPDWIGAVPYVDWWTGSAGGPTVLLENNNEEAPRQSIYNVIGRIEGYEQPSSKVIVGNHRDAWCFGAIDPGSGTSIQMELVRVFTDLARLGWRPLRTIEFVSWDAEEYNMIGSTEHVEAHLDDLRQHGVAYMNLDAAAFGSKLWATASPPLELAWPRALEQIWDIVDEDPDAIAAGNSEMNATGFKQLWIDQGGKIDAPGAGSDYVAFQHLAGVSIIDFGMRGSSYPYHSCHDSFEMVDSVFDRGWRHHKQVAQIAGMLLLELADAPLLPFDMETYANAMEEYLNGIVKFATDKQAQGLDFGPLSDAVGIMRQAAKSFRVWEEGWEQVVYQTGIENQVLAAERAQHNLRAAAFEKDLLDLAEGGGLPGREQFKHVVFSPAKWQGYEAAIFVGIREPIEEGNWDAAQKEIVKVARLIEQASENLLK